MSAKLLRTGAAILVAGLSWPTVTLAFDPIYPFTDPLRTMPEVIEQGVVLPGDSAPIPCSVQKDFSRPLALGEAVDLALCNNPQIRSAWADIKIQAGALGEARAAYLPALTGSLNRTNDRIRYSDSRYPSSNITRNTAQGTLNWRLFDFGGRAANHQAAENLLAAALANHNATLQKALSSVVQAYFEAVTAKAALVAKTAGEEIAQKTLHSARQREEKGASSQSDTLQATTALAKSSLEKNRAQGEYGKSLSVLGYILGIPANTALSLPEDLGESRDEHGKALSEWLEETQKNHPAILAARNQLEAAQQRVTVARSAGMPTVALTSSYYQNTRPGEAVTSTDAKETTVGVTLSIPIFDGFSSTHKVRGAQAQVEQKEAALADTEHQIAMELIKAHADAASALNNLEASAHLLDAARSALNVSQRKYDKGAADIIEILNTQGALADAEKERIRCLAEWRSARLRLLASAGRIGRSAVAAK
ncbi:MAG: TolC family protein [Desulfobulbaceae bacterium]|nr:TolC family protein [Desulfobulbaceae bacterium]HIJ89333.1 TolC family protein [Deltaproteobacteria bacterium]